MAASLSTENYDRLTKVARLDYSDEDASLLNDLKAQLASLKTACASFSGNTGVEGATHAAMTSKVSDFEASIANLEGRVETMETAHTQARQAMQEAKSVQGTLSTQLLHPSDQAAAQVIAQGEPNEAAIQNEYIQNMMAQRNAQREAKAKAALDAMNGQVTSAAAGFSGDSSNGDGDSNGGGGSSSRDTGVAGAGSRGGTQYAAGGSAGVGSAGSGAPIAGLEVLPSVSPSSSVLAGVDVTTMPVGGYMTPDGPAGGHIPAPVTDADDPRWKPDYNPFSTSSQSKDLAIAGGALTTGGTLAGLGRMATSATSIASSMGGFASRAATSQFGTVPAGGALAPSTSARLSSSNAISSAMNDLERGALTPRGTAQAGNWGNAARMANPGTPASAAARTGGFPRGMGAPGAYGSGATAGTGAGTSSTASNASTMSARARAAASIRPTGATGTTATGAPANGAAAGPLRAQQRAQLLLRQEQARSPLPLRLVQLQLLPLVRVWAHGLALWEQLLVQHPVRPRLLRAVLPGELRPRLRLHRLPRLLQQELGQLVALPQMATCQEALPPQQPVALRRRPPAVPSVRERLLVQLQRKKRTKRSVAR